jgi:Rrf2 family protein
VLSKSAEYALRATTFLACQEVHSASASLLARKTKTPRRYLHRVLQDLVAAGLLESRPGPGGGYALAHAPEAITVFDVVNAVSPLERITACPLGLTNHTELCPLHKLIDGAVADTENCFRRASLSDLVESREVFGGLCDVP